MRANPFNALQQYWEPTTTRIELNDLTVEVVFKSIKHLHLRIYAASGLIRLSAPRRMKLETIRSFLVSKTDWIEKQRHKLGERTIETPHAFVDGETHFLWGNAHTLTVDEKPTAAAVYLAPRGIVMQVRIGSDATTRKAIMNAWYRSQLAVALPELVTKWESRIGVHAKAIHLQKMKTRWGSCNTRTHHIRFNSELAKKPPICLEYVVVHELVHLLEPSHNHRFYHLMNQFMPDWKHVRSLLNHFPAGHQQHPD